MTMGDAVASFLDKDDPVTRNMCIISLKDFKKSKGYVAGPRQWNDTRYRWKDVTSKTRRIVTIFMQVTLPVYPCISILIQPLGSL